MPHVSRRIGSGPGFATNDYLGLGLAIITIHDMPEEIAMAALKMGVARLNTLYNTSRYTDGYRGIYRRAPGDIQNVHMPVPQLCGGAMLYITCGELIPKTQSIRKDLNYRNDTASCAESISSKNLTIAITKYIPCNRKK